MNELWVVDFYSDEDWDRTMKVQADAGSIHGDLVEYTMYEKLWDEAHCD